MQQSPTAMAAKSNAASGSSIDRMSAKVDSEFFSLFKESSWYIELALVHAMWSLEIFAMYGMVHTTWEYLVPPKI